jgi:hypothetical protein
MVQKRTGDGSNDGDQESDGKSWRKQNRPEFIARFAEGDNDFAIHQTHRPSRSATRQNKNAASPKEGGVLFDHDT